MDAEQLSRFADFEGWSARRMESVARSVRRLKVPAGRWLVRPGRSLAARVFLVEGRVRLLDAGRSVIVNAGSARARRAVYPGAAGVQSLTSAVFVSLDPVLLEAAGAVRPEGAPGIPELLAEESWQRRFLTSPLMRRLGPVAWQRILRATRRTDYGAGARVIEAGEPAACCHVLCSGRAEIRIGERVVAVLSAGGLFGEDALVSGRPRNATVVMTVAGSAVSLPAEQFQRWLLDAVVRPLAEPGARPILSLSGEGPDGAVRLQVDELRRAGAGLSSAESYAVVGGRWSERTLAAFLLAEQGIDARPVAAGSP